MVVPASILRRLYVKGSLSNTETGFKFSLKNPLADATLIKPLTITVDGKPVELGNIKLLFEGKTINNSEISASSPVDFNVNTTVQIFVDGIKLEPGEHLIIIMGSTREYGDIKFDVKDILK